MTKDELNTLQVGDIVKDSSKGKTYRFWFRKNSELILVPYVWPDSYRDLPIAKHGETFKYRDFIGTRFSKLHSEQMEGDSRRRILAPLVACVGFMLIVLNKYHFGNGIALEHIDQWGRIVLVLCTLFVIFRSIKLLALTVAEPRQKRWFVRLYSKDGPTADDESQTITSAHARLTKA